MRLFRLAAVRRAMRAVSFVAAFAAFCGWRRAGVRCGRFFAAVFAFLRCLRLSAGGRFFAAFCGWRRAGVGCGQFFAAVFEFGGGRAEIGRAHV